MNEWSKWDYEKGFVMPQINVFDMKSHLFYPIRQWGPGKPYGFLMLIDANTDDYYCPMSDAEGIVFTLHNSIEIPHVKEFPSVLDTNKEIYIKVNPDVTFADSDIPDLSSEKRQCYFGNEQTLKLFRPYTRTNCITDCIANRIAKTCNCSYFYMPREKGVRICNTEVESPDGKCVEAVNHYLRTSIKRLICGHCLALCEELDYTYEATMVGLQNLSQIWLNGSTSENNTNPDW
ncbi:unnamed protein product [Orchesella dallaii]|uniref:Pickpocket protein 28 n=1 Tax=Orchesella dallaii TaxID=48710 RepID=A0ABP1RID9_9HEXA